MSTQEDNDDIAAMERSDTAHKLPLGWLILFGGLILWGIYYFVSYSPAISGWTQAGELEDSLDD